MAKFLAALLVLLAGLGLPTARAGFRSPESLVRNVYAYYGDRSSELSSGLPHDPATARQFFDPLHHAEFHPGQRSRRLGDFRRREPA